MKTVKNAWANIKKWMANDQGGVSPLVVTIGLALLLLAAIVLLVPQIRTGLETAITNLMTDLANL